MTFLQKTSYHNYQRLWVTFSLLQSDWLRNFRAYNSLILCRHSVNLKWRPFSPGVAKCLCFTYWRMRLLWGPDCAFFLHLTPDAKYDVNEGEVRKNSLRLSNLFSQYRSCDDSKESIFFQSWTFSCLHAVFL